MAATISTKTDVFKEGWHAVELINVSKSGSNSLTVPPPPKPLLVATPLEEGEYSVLVFLHGYELQNIFYSELIRHLASHGFIVVAPQLYWLTCCDSTGEIRSAAAVIDWLHNGLTQILSNKTIKPNMSRVAVGGHSRGGKVASALLLGYAETKVKISATILVDPVDGLAKGNQTKPPILTYVPESLDFKTPVLIVGCALSPLKKNPVFPPCAAEGVNQQEFFEECASRPLCHLVAKEYGHMDMLDDETKGIVGRITYCMCKNGNSRKPMRLFLGGAMVAFMRAYLEDNGEDLNAIRLNPAIAPVELSVHEFLD